MIDFSKVKPVRANIDFKKVKPVIADAATKPTVIKDSPTEYSIDFSQLKAVRSSDSPILPKGVSKEQILDEGLRSKREAALGKTFTDIEERKARDLELEKDLNTPKSSFGWPTEKDQSGKPKVYLGAKAVKRVSELSNKELSLAERRVVEEEGYVAGDYKDDKGIQTSGVGQTGKWSGKTFSETFESHKQDARRLVKDFDSMPEYLQAELVQITYRGDLQQSPNMRKLLNSGKYKEAAKELLNNQEYIKRKKKGDDGVTRRLEALHDAIIKYSRE